MTQKQTQQDMDWESHFVALMQACDTEKCRSLVLLELVDFLGYERVIQAYNSSIVTHDSGVMEH